MHPTLEKLQALLSQIPTENKLLLNDVYLLEDIFRQYKEIVESLPKSSTLVIPAVSEFSQIEIELRKATRKRGTDWKTRYISARTHIKSDIEELIKFGDW